MYQIFNALWSRDRYDKPDFFPFFLLCKSFVWTFKHSFHFFFVLVKSQSVAKRIRWTFIFSESSESVSRLSAEQKSSLNWYQAMRTFHVSHYIFKESWYYVTANNLYDIMYKERDTQLLVCVEWIKSISTDLNCFIKTNYR